MTTKDLEYYVNNTTTAGFETIDFNFERNSTVGSGQFSSVAQSCPTLCDMDRSMPGLPVHHHLPSSRRLTSIESVMPPSHLILLSSPFPPVKYYQTALHATEKLFTKGRADPCGKPHCCLILRNCHSHSGFQQVLP